MSGLSVSATAERVKRLEERGVIRGYAAILAQIRELDENWWLAHGDDLPTPRAIVEHVRLMDAADLRWPVILSADMLLASRSR